MREAGSGQGCGQGCRQGGGTRADDPLCGQVPEEGGHQRVPAGVQLIAVDANVEFEPGRVGVVGRLPCREERLGFTAADPAARQPPPPQQQQQCLVGMGRVPHPQALPGTRLMEGEAGERPWLSVKPLTPCALHGAPGQIPLNTGGQEDVLGWLEGLGVFPHNPCRKSLG